MNNGTCCAPGEKRCGCDNDLRDNSFKRISCGSTNDMTRLDGGSFLMGTDDACGYPDDGEGPVHEVTLNPFYIDRCAVSNAEFSRFIQASGYETDAEKFGYSYVFHLLLPPSLKRTLDMLGRTVQGLEWWYHVEGADWAYPFGPDRGTTPSERTPAIAASTAGDPISATIPTATATALPPAPPTPPTPPPGTSASAVRGM